MFSHNTGVATAIQFNGVNECKFNEQKTKTTTTGKQYALQQQALNTKYKIVSKSNKIHRSK